jgi:2-methylcitrate dehydratase PrpD
VSSSDERSLDAHGQAPGVLSRRRLLETATTSMAALALAGCERTASVATGAATSAAPTRDAGPPPRSDAATDPVAGAAPPASRQPDLTGRLARYMAQAWSADLPPLVALAAKHRILDTLGAIVSGARLLPGEVAIEYVRGLGGTPEAQVATTDIMTTAINAAFANAMFGHADETDDFHPHTKAHPGCAVVPAALALGELETRSGRDLLNAVTLGYDLCCRLLMALGPDHVRARGRSAEGFSSTFGAMAAAAAMARFDELHMRYAISYGAQQISGIWSWPRDGEHIEKAFDFSGMGARNGVAAVRMVQAGFTGVSDALEGEHNVIDALSEEPRPEEIVAALGSRYYVAETAIKTFPVGYPIQSPLDAFFTLREQHGLDADTVEHMLVRLPADGARIVDNRAMPDVNLQHILAVALIDGEINFENSHSFERMQDPAVLAIRPRIELVADAALMDPAAPRSGFVEVRTRDGRSVNRFVSHAPGTPENPLTTERVNAKARSLMTPVLGADRTELLIERVNALEDVADLRELRALLSA